MLDLLLQISGKGAPASIERSLIDRLPPLVCSIINSFKSSRDSVDMWTKSISSQMTVPNLFELKVCLEGLICLQNRRGGCYESQLFLDISKQGTIVSLTLDLKRYLCVCGLQMCY